MTEHSKDFGAEPWPAEEDIDEVHEVIDCTPEALFEAVAASPDHTATFRIGTGNLTPEQKVQFMAELQEILNSYPYVNAVVYPRFEFETVEDLERIFPPEEN
jgi:hypothetical protein